MLDQVTYSLLATHAGLRGLPISSPILLNLRKTAVLSEVLPTGAKTDVRYWEGKIFHDAYTRNGERIQMSEWSVRIQHEGRRETFQLETPNKAAAAAKAKEIFFSLRGGGWEDALQRFKPTIAKPEGEDRGEASVGDLLREAQLLGGGVRARTLRIILNRSGKS